MKKGKNILKVFIFALILLFLPKSVLARDIPNSPSTYYLDELNVLDQDTKDHLTKVNKELEQKTGSQVIFVSLDDMDDDPAQFGAELINKWGIGDKDEDNGVLILLTQRQGQDKRDIHIITGYGIEGRLNDGKVGRIIDN